MALLDLIFGKPIATDDEADQRIGATAGIPIFGLDALGSAAYGPEAALTILIPLGAIGLAYALPITVSIVVLWRSSTSPTVKPSPHIRPAADPIRWHDSIWERASVCWRRLR